MTVIDVLHLAEQLAHQVHAPHRLAARAIELVLQVGVLEILEVERRGVLHQPDAGRVGEQFRQQSVGIADHAPEQVGERSPARIPAAATGRGAIELAAGPCRRQRVEAQPEPTSRTASSMINLPTYSVMIGSSARTRRRPRLTSVNGLLVPRSGAGTAGCCAARRRARAGSVAWPDGGVAGMRGVWRAVRGAGVKALGQK